MGRPRETTERDVDRLRVHAAYSRRIGRHSLADALDRGADAVDEVTALRRYLEFIEVLCDGGGITVNDVPWREAFDRMNALMSDPVRPASHPTPSGSNKRAPQ